MKRADEAIGKVLAGLSETRAGAGFEERMARRVREAAGDSRKPFFGDGWKVRVLAGGGLAMVVVAVGVVVHVGFGPDGRVAPARGIGKEHGAAVVSAELRREDARQEVEGGEARRKATVLSERPRGDRSGLKQAERLEMEGGFPAPAMPLTAQERLLLRAAQGGDALPVAVLTIRALPAHDAEERAEFVAFFEQDQQIKPGESE